MTINVTLHTPDNPEVPEGSYIDAIRTALQWFEGAPWDKGHAEALTVLVTETNCNSKQRLLRAIKAGTEAALEDFPKDKHGEILELTEPHRQDAVRRYEAHGGNRPAKPKGGRIAAAFGRNN